MDKQALKLLEAISHFPPDVNPYLATAKLLEAKVHSLPSPPWARRLRIALLIFTELMLFQSVFLLYQRLRISKRPKIKFNNLGLVVINISYIAGLSYFSFSLSTIYTLLVHIAVDMGHQMDQSEMLLVFGLKFFPPIISAWAFVWVCACQTARILWNSELASRLGRHVLKNVISWGLSIFFIILAFGPLPAIAWRYIKAYNSLKAIERITHHLSSTLQSKADTYDPVNFSPISILPLLIPAKKMLPIQDELEDSLRHGQKLYLSVLFVLCTIYIPFLTISLRGLYKQSVFQAAIDAASGSGSRPKRSPFSRRIHQQRQRLVWHAICAYLATSTHIPILLYEHILSGSPGFTQNELWQQITFQGLTIPLAFTGNIVLAILNMHAFLIRQEKARGSSRTTLTTPVNSEETGLFQKAINFARGFVSVSDDNAIQLDNLESNSNGNTNEDKDPGVTQKDQEVTLPTLDIKIIRLTSFSSSR